MLIRAPGRHALRPFVQLLWARDDRSSPPCVASRVERVLPTGCVHLAFRLGEDPVRLYEGLDDEKGRAVGHAVVGGARSSYYLRDPAPAAASLGVLLQPAAAALLLGVPADRIAETHTELAGLWGDAAVRRLRERLSDAGTAEQRLDRLEAELLARLPPQRGPHPAVAQALLRLAAAAPVARVVEEAGYSHRRFNELFREHVGLSPKRFARVRRLVRVLRTAAERPASTWADVAQACGFCDEAHLSREFGALAGLTPGGWARSPRVSGHHVAASGSTSYKPERASRPSLAGTAFPLRRMG